MPSLQSSIFMASTSVILPYPPTSLAVLGLKGRAFLAGKPWIPPPTKPISCHLSSSSASIPLLITSPQPETRPQRRLPIRSSGSEVSTTAFSSPTIDRILHLVVSLGVILAVDKILKQAFAAAAIKFPSALFGMFCVFSVLTALDSVAPSAAMGLMDFFEPATLFIQRWLPLFYVPSLVVLPLAVRDVPAASGLKICFILVAGWAATLSVAGYTAVAIRSMVRTEMIPAEPMTKPSPFSTLEVCVWSAIFVSSFGLALLNPTVMGTNARTCLPFLLAATVLGYMVGSRYLFTP